MRHATSTLFTAAILALGAASGCHAGDPADAGDGPAGGLRVTIPAPKSAALGREVEVSAELENRGASPVAPTAPEATVFVVIASGPGPPDPPPASSTSSVKLPPAVASILSVTCTSKVNVWRLLKVPDNTPVMGSMVSPPGRLMADQVYGGTPPLPAKKLA